LPAISTTSPGRGGESRARMAAARSGSTTTRAGRHAREDVATIAAGDLAARVVVGQTMT
jgi:hypothetical protein